MDKLSPWHETPEAPPTHPEEEEPEEEEKMEEEPEVMVTIAAASPMLAAISECPSMLQESAEAELSQSEEQGAEPAVTSPHLDRVSLMIPDRNITSPGQDVLSQTSPNRTPPQLLLSSPPRTAEEPSPLSSPRVKGRRAILRETGSETPPTIPLCRTSPAPSPPPSAVLSSSPRSLLKRQEEPMVVLHCLPSQHLPPKSPSANSDTDSATEEEEELTPREKSTPTEEELLLPQERSNSATKRKAAEEELLPQEKSSSFLRRKGAEKKLCPERRQEDGPSPSKPPSSPLRPDRSSNASQRTEEEAPHPEKEVQNKPAEELLVGGANKEAEVHDGTPPPSAEDPAPSEEAEPQMGPEALVCHEVDLDDPDEKEKPTSSAEHLLLMVREEQQVLPPLPRVVHSSLPQIQARPFLIGAGPAPCSEELGLVPGGLQRGDSSPGFEGSTSSSSTCPLSLQDAKERGKEGGPAPPSDVLFVL